MFGEQSCRLSNSTKKCSSSYINGIFTVSRNIFYSRARLMVDFSFINIFKISQYTGQYFVCHNHVFVLIL